MILDVREHEGKELTGEEMHRMVRGFWSDLGAMVNLPFPRFFDFVRLLPYESDEERFKGITRVIELVPRPAYLLDPKIFPRLDCKKKAILVAAWAYAHGLPYRFLAVSNKPDQEVHHVFPQIDFGQGWVNVDATFPQFRIGQGQPVTFAAELRP